MDSCWLGSINQIHPGIPGIAQRGAIQRVQIDYVMSISHNLFILHTKKDSHYCVNTLHQRKIPSDE